MKSVALPWGVGVTISARIQAPACTQPSTPAEYLDYVKKNEGAELVELLDAISTNVTSFFEKPSILC